MSTPRSKASPLSRYALGLWFLGIAALGFVRFFMKAFDDSGFQPTTDAWLWLAGAASTAIVGLVRHRAGIAQATPTARITPLGRRRASGHESEIAGREIAEIREDQVELRFAHAEPARQRRRVLIDGRGRNDLAPAGVVGPVVLQRGMRAEEASAAHRAADHEMVRAPAVVGAVAVRRQRAAEVRGGEGVTPLGDAQFDGGVVERIDAPATTRRAASAGPPAGRSWWSKPPIETKKIWRLRLRLLRTPISRATILSCCAERAARELRGQCAARLPGRLPSAIALSRERLNAEAKPRSSDMRLRALLPSAPGSRVAALLVPFEVGRSARAIAAEHVLAGGRRRAQDRFPRPARPSSGSSHRDWRLNSRSAMRPPQPRLRRVVGARHLPVALLVVVREQLRRQRARCRPGYCALVTGCDQRADIAEDRRLAAVEQRLQAASCPTGSVAVDGRLQAVVGAVGSAAAGYAAPAAAARSAAEPASRAPRRTGCSARRRAARPC